MPNTPTNRMTIEQARAVYWLRNNHRPLGELFDEGFLNESRLAWAAEKAYNPQLKEAATVLLEALRQGQVKTSPPPATDALQSTLSPVQAPITVERARETRWPFRPFKGEPLGKLLDTRQLTLKNLAYAIENAWDERVRQAAIVLMAVRLNQVVEEPAPAAGPLKVVTSGDSYSVRRRLTWTRIEGLFIGVTCTVAAVYVYNGIKNSLTKPIFPNPFQSIESFLAFFIIIALGLISALILDRFTDLLVFNRIDTELDNARKGQEGEDLVVEMLRQHLDGNWTLFCNVTLPGRNPADIDGVLVGPPGVWALEIKNYTGTYLNYGDRWGRIQGNKRKRLKRSPSQQAQQNAARLSGFLKADGIKQYIHPVIIWANRESAVKVKHPIVPVWPLDQLPEELGNLWQDQTLQEDAQTRIVEKLTDLCERAVRKKKS